MISHDEYNEVRTPLVTEFFEYISDMVRVFISDNHQSLDMDYFFCHGGVFESRGIYNTFTDILTEQYGSNFRIQRFSDILECETDRVVTQGLADIATELLMVKKDPLVRILRYVLYNYE